MRSTVVIFAAGIAAAAAPASAADPALGVIDEMKAGVLAHDVPGLWSNSSKEPGTTFNVEAIFAPRLDVLWGEIRPNLGASITTEGGTSYGYAGARYEIDGGWGGFFSAGLGAAVHDGRLAAGDPNRKGLGSRVLFHVPIELGYRFAEHYSISAYFEHVSNGGIGTNTNEGLDNLGVRLGYRF
jgi:lipid A 3-O-deacylase